jgi:hypothetical protein
MAGYIPVPVTGRIDNGEAQDLLGYAVSPNYFPVLGIEPSLGRPFAAAEEDGGAASMVAIISHSLWRHRYGADVQVLGRQIVLNDRPFTIVGVGPARFMDTEPLSPDVWVPIGAQPVVSPGTDLNNRQCAIRDAHPGVVPVRSPPIRSTGGPGRACRTRSGRVVGRVHSPDVRRCVDPLAALRSQ